MDAKQKTPALSYAAPRLVRFGSVVKLTASGTGTNTESGSQPNCDNSTNKNRC